MTFIDEQVDSCMRHVRDVVKLFDYNATRIQLRRQKIAAEVRAKWTSLILTLSTTALIYMHVFKFAWHGH